MKKDRDDRRRLLEMVTGAWISQTIHVAAKLGLPDLLAAGPLSPGALAEASGTQADVLRRLMRALECFGVLVRDGEGRFGLTALGEGLRSDAPGSLRYYAIMIGERWVWNSWAELQYSIQTGQPAFDRLHGKEMFDYLATDAEASRIFNEAMSSRSRQEIPAIIAAYPWPAGTIVDVGGGHGMLIHAILAAQQNARGILFDLPAVVGSSKPIPPELADRFETVEGNFFESVSGAADLYILKRVIHDWDDRDSVRILNRIRAAMHPDSRLLIMEHVLASDNSGLPGILLDMQMLVMTSGGRERTKAEYAALLADANLKLARVISTDAGIGLVEAVPV